MLNLVPPFEDSSDALRDNRLPFILMDLTPMECSCKENRGVYVTDLEISEPKTESWGPWSDTRMPSDDDRQIVNFCWVPRAVDICDGRAMGVLPRPIIPLAPLARPFSKNVGAQEKTN